MRSRYPNSRNTTKFGPLRTIYIYIRAFVISHSPTPVAVLLLRHESFRLCYWTHHFCLAIMRHCCPAHSGFEYKYERSSTSFAQRFLAYPLVLANYPAGRSYAVFGYAHCHLSSVNSILNHTLVILLVSPVVFIGTCIWIIWGDTSMQSICLHMVKFAEFTIKLFLSFDGVSALTPSKLGGDVSHWSTI